MNFLVRATSNTNHHAPKDPLPAVQEASEDVRFVSKPGGTLEGLIAEDPFPESPLAEDRDGEMSEGMGSENGSVAGPSGKSDSVLENHKDVTEEEGWIAIPYRELPDDWNNAPSIQSLLSLDRSFVFPGEQLHILVCLSACKEDTEIITPFKVAAVMSKNGIGNSPEKKNAGVQVVSKLVPGEGEMSSDAKVLDQNGNDHVNQKTDPQKDISDSESFLRMEDHRRQTEILLQRFENSYFFVRVAESGEPLWSRKTVKDPDFTERDSETPTTTGTKGNANNISHLNALIDRGNFDANVFGGSVRNTVKCCSLSNGDIVVLLEINVGVNFLRDPVIEILQFEKYRERNSLTENQENLNYGVSDPCGELLKWLLPLDNTLPPPARSLSPPHISSISGIGGSSRSSSSGSQFLSHFRSYSMSSLPQSAASPSQPLKAQSSKASFDLDDWDQYSSQKLWKSQRTGEGLLSFRGVSLERERFSVRCGLEGIHIPGRRWRRKVEIIQPIEIHSFAADCNTDDLLCVQIKNVSPAHTSDIVVYIDAITIVFEEASKVGPPSSLPIACIEAGNDHALPNLALRRGEEHSFILKPVSSAWKNLKVHSEKVSQPSNLRLASNTIEGGRGTSNADQFAIMVSCRCNYTESRLFFKQVTSWQPRISRDLKISVASEMSGQSSGPSGRVSELPVQVLTLQASNLTPEDLTLTVLAPASFTSATSVGSLGSSPKTPMTTFTSLPQSTGIISTEKHGSAVQRLNSIPSSSGSKKQMIDDGAHSFSFSEQSSSIPDVVPSTGLGFTHLWLQSRVPLGCVPAQSTATIRLELLPLTDGIITLDTLQIDVRERGVTYIPEHSLKINATSSVSTGIN